MKLWIDDLRNPKDFIRDADEWTWAKDSFEAIAYLKKAMLKYIPVEAVSFDHDLGGDDTTRPVVLWMCENDFWPDVCYVHSSNPPGVDWLAGMISRYGPGVSRG